MVLAFTCELDAIFAVVCMYASAQLTLVPFATVSIMMLRDNHGI